MKENKTILVLFFIFMSISVQAINQKHTREQADSIMGMVIQNAERYQNLLSSVESEIYIKGRTEILKQNVLIRLAHHLFPVNRRQSDMVFEMVSESKYEPPNLFSHNFKAINGSSIPNSKKQQEAFLFLNLNVYASTAYDDAILMPVAKNAFNYYDFKLMDVADTTGVKIYRIRFLPKYLSQKLISGDLYVIDEAWTIDKIDMSGRFAFADFNLEMTYGRGLNRFNLPESADIFIRYHILGNAVVTSYHSKFNYKSIVWSLEPESKKRRKSSLDLTNHFKLSSDTVPIIVDTTYWQHKRDIPLSPEENKLYENVTDKRLQAANPDSSINQEQRYLKLTEKLTSSINLNFKSARLRYSGLLNPFQLGYSKFNGITYRQRVRFYKTYKNDSQLRLRPEIGFVFKRKEVYFKLTADWEYCPQRMGTLSFLVGNGNQTYSHQMMSNINEQLKDSIFDYDDLGLQYFKHYYWELNNRIEIANGLLLTTGITYNNRRPTEKRYDLNVPPEVSDIINSEYNDFTPSIALSYTPRQYYRMDGKRKEYLHSYYPTISIEYAKAIPNVWRSEGDFERIEADIHQSVSLGFLRKLNYHISSGMYTRQKSTYFADFRYFTRRNFPDTWDDQIGGIFNLLGREWFNAADKYLQTHFMYQSPFIFLRFHRKAISKYVFCERLYLSQLWTPALPSYTEIGYGLGNHIFNIAIFAGFEKDKYQSFGFRFAFELFQ
ncbi:hypothetical protein M2459_000973 [Parabacteroides sp. PF5-5]|nr:MULTISPECIES: DUF5686 family protein [unclassified Parabacteroides]MDH6315040.1 hypothetical protein [Parabacteroides sp. PF5-13]MDH6326435.1 hypothetical protein [Parabacteroides sp. PH5-41]MDH6334235.1 hypothetical protein [Parabacteroides sp. PF5-5]MDH6345095.1 hypothetical protein [Parabacteroides sp. PH5-46]MDH6360256.1 hypothetical protein [Parabacteroides sp. PH5-16]